MLFYFYDMADTSIDIGIVQFDIAWENPAANMAYLDHLLQEASGLDLILLPEMWSTGFTMHPEKAAESVPGPALEWMTTTSRRIDAVITGSLAVRDQGQYYNRWYCALPDGRLVSYDKKHLFSYGKEDQHYTSGQQQVVIEWKGWKIRPIVCYDLRFPVWIRNTQDYDLLLVAANWPAVRIHHWDALLRARAIENQCYVAAVNRVGTDGNGLVYNGHSAVYDMNGMEVLTGGDTIGFLKTSLNMTSLRAFRDQFRFLQDRDRFSLEGPN